MKNDNVRFKNSISCHCHSRPVSKYGVNSSGNPPRSCGAGQARDDKKLSSYVSLALPSTALIAGLTFFKLSVIAAKRIFKDDVASSLAGIR